ncbi:MAG: ABC transporter ATP-binding protein [Clostridia bacterium]|nr:ABC transporter ATP-binding protein [Clostridia bacterium]
MDDIIKIEHLFKSYGDVKAVRDLSFRVRRGELFAFLGVNGAGKSTTISMICGHLRPDSGEISVCGMDVERDFEKISRKIGVVFQSSALDAQLSPRDNLRSRAALYGITGAAFEARFAELSASLDFADFANRPLNKLSGGQKRRIDIARALIHEPEILILDEPTTGLDPQTRKLLWDVIESLRHEKQMTVFLTTHYMEEAADADYVVIIDSGEIAAEGSPLELKNRFAGDYITLYGADTARIEALGLEYKTIRDAVRIAVPDTARVTELIVSEPSLFTDYEVTKGKMDDVFLAVTGKDLPGGGLK